MTDRNEIIILRVIKYFPSTLILLIAMTISFFVYNEHQKNLITEKKFIEKEYLEQSKKEIKALLDTTSSVIIDMKNDHLYNLKKELKNQITNAYAISYSIYNKYKNIKTKEEITQLIKTALRNIRFNNDRGYLFIYEMNGLNIMNAQFPNLEGKVLWNYQDLKGVYLLQEMNNILKNKSETYYDWYWKKTEDLDKHYKKVGFFKKFEPYDWFIGTGEYLDDYSIKLKQTILSYIKKLRYKDNNYIFITNKEGVILTNKYSKLIGKNVNNLKGDHIKENFKDLLRSKSGVFIEYTLDRDSTSEKEQRKYSYLKLLDEWDWVIGTGFDLNNANSIIEKKHKILEEKYNSYLKNSIIIAMILIIILLILSTILSKYIEKIFYKYKSDLEHKHKILLKAQKTAKIGDWNLNLDTMEAYWSEEIISMLGLKEIPEHFGPEFLNKIMHPDDWDCFQTSMENAIKNDKEHSCTYRVIRPLDNKIIWVDCKGRKSSTNNYIYGTIQDITKRKLLEEDKQKQETLLYQQSKMAAMGEMIGNIAHQWRQPLSIISTSATGAKLQNDMGLLNSNNINSYLDTINNTAQYLSQTIEDFRGFFDPKQDKEITIDIKNTIEKTLTLIKAEFVSKDIKLIKNIHDIKITTLENELIQALINILNNARDALIENIEGPEKNVFINVYQNKSNVIIEIKDNANGVPKEIKERVFEPYFTTKHQLHGTGIGLYMSREIITKLLKGSIHVKNETFTYENKKYTGAVFTIELPIVE